MRSLRGQLFWKIYVTLLISLIAVAVLMGAIWRLVGETPEERWINLRSQVTSATLPVAAVTDATLQGIADRADTDLSVYANDGRLLAHAGRVVILRDDLTRQEQHWRTRIDLSDGLVVMARLRPPAHDPGRRILLAVLSVATAAGLAAIPMTARLTRRLEALRSGMARWGAGDTAARLDERGSDEVALVARTFNSAAERLDALLRSQRALLANASHELRSPLARLRVAVELAGDAPSPATRGEIVRSLGEIDALVEEILLSSRLDHAGLRFGPVEPVDLLGLAAEEAVRVGAQVAGQPVEIIGNRTLLQRMLRNLLENAERHGAAPIEVSVRPAGLEAEIVVADRGLGVAETERERVFDAFYRPAGHGESGGGWGLGLALVRQIATHHGGRVACEGEQRGSSFVVHLPLHGSPAEALPNGPRFEARSA